jgi:transketolase
MYSSDKKVIETIRFLSIDAINKANSGHPGLPMGCATMAYALFKNFMQTSATDPYWINRDRFVLSAGHGSMLLYSLFHLFGYDLSIDEIKKFRQLGSITPGHPEYGVTKGVETTTGPLGQGIANAVGMAMAQRKLASEFNTEDFDIINYNTYAIVGDGDLMEGISYEAMSLAGHLKLNKLIVLYDDNSITIDGRTDITFTENIEQRHVAMGWNVLKVNDGNDYNAVVDAISKAKESDKPTLIMVKNVIGYGSPNKADKSAAHGSPLGKDETRLVKEAFGWNPDLDFYVPNDVYEYLKEIIDSREVKRFNWEEKLEKYFDLYPNLKEKWNKWFSSGSSLDELNINELLMLVNKDDATRNHGGVVMNHLAKYVPNMFGGSADLNGSTKTYLKGLGDFTKENPSGSNVFFGIREHSMAAIVNGINLSGALRGYGATFLSFADYMKPSIRLSALMGINPIFVFTHDSIGVGEDGPTHQPIEQVEMLRSIPGLNVYRPCDGAETAYAWISAITSSKPSAIILSRQTLKRQDNVDDRALKGAYILYKESKENIDLIFMATGSEVELAVESAKKLEIENGLSVRVVSVLSREVFMSQEEAYKEFVLPRTVIKRISIEAGLTTGWYRFLGLDGLAIGLDRFGESGPDVELMKHFGFTLESVYDKAIAYMSK